MQVTSRSFRHGEPVPERLAFGVPADDGPMGFGENRSPHLAWEGAPAATRSFVLLCVDDDVPTDASEVNQEGRTLPADMPRCDFYHWVLVDLPRTVTELAEGACSDAVVPGGKRDPAGPPGSRQGLNDYTGFMAGSELAGDYFGYDGPCPPWNDERLHHYHFRVYALDTERLELPARFDGRDVEQAMAGHVLASASLTGSYTLNPALR